MAKEMIHAELNRKMCEFSVNIGLTALDAVCCSVLVLRGDVFFVIPVVSAAICIKNAIDCLREARELKEEEVEAERREEQFAKELMEMRRRAREESVKTPSAVCDGSPPSRGRLRKRGKVIFLALHHKKARVRKKNANRIIREEKRNGR